MSDEIIAKEVINSFFKSIGIQRKWNEPVNDEVAEIFARMLDEVRKCSDAISWIPKPSGKATVSWLARQLGRSFIEKMNGKTSLACARYSVNAYLSAMIIASHG